MTPGFLLPLRQSASFSRLLTFALVLFCGLMSSPAVRAATRNTPGASADIVVSKTADEAVAVGGQITYSLAVFNAWLFIGTRTQGLVAFDGAQFDRYRWNDRTSQSIDALLADEGRLLIGTRAGGLIAFDGSHFKELTAGAEQKRLLEINLLSKDGPRLFVGTFADGLWIEEGGRWSHFRTANGLLSNRVVGVAIANQNLFVATDFGLTVAPVANLSTGESQTSP